jgi:hypothetical protein
MYPIQYAADYVERRSRLTTFFRFLTVIPAALLTMVYGFAATFVLIAAWFAVVFTGRYPASLYGFMAGYLRNSTRLTAYANLVTDAYPPFNGQPDDSYPVKVHVAAPLERYSRVKALFRVILAIPAMIIAYVFSILVSLMSFLGWFAIVFTGKMPKSLQDLLDLGLRYITRANAYGFLLVEAYPPISDQQQLQPPPEAPAISGD